MKTLANKSLFFYQTNKLISIKKDDQQHTIFRTNDLPMAEQLSGKAPGNGLLATDEKGSVLAVQEDD